MAQSKSADARTRALVLTGGGARGAYQAGLVRGLAQISGERRGGLPFGILSGISAGAINAAYLAATADGFVESANQLAQFWSELRTRDVIRTDAASLASISLRLVSDVVMGGLKRRKGTRSLLDTAPLASLLGRRIAFGRIPRHIAANRLAALALTATDYANSENITFLAASDPDISWVRAGRRSLRANIALPHVMASAALPLLFPPVSVDGRFYGDGCLRNTAPLAPAVSLGARKMLIVGVRYGDAAEDDSKTARVKPTFGRVMSVLLNAILMDSVEFDIERLARLNEIVQDVPATRRRERGVRCIDYLYIRPSEDLGALASSHFSALPDILKYLINGLGSRQDASELVSYLLFEPGYCGALADLGYRDAMAHRDKIEDFLAD